ncbi:unnamed protein product [Rhodiola kirilowii]
MAEADDDSVSLETRPGILMPILHAWKIDTKYYTADVTLWMADLTEELCVNNLPSYTNLAALVIVFDLNDLTSFDALKKFVCKVDLKKFDVLSEGIGLLREAEERGFKELCVGMVRGEWDRSGNGKVVEQYLPQGEEAGWVSATGKSAVFDAGGSSNGCQDGASGCSGEREGLSTSVAVVQEKSVGEGLEAQNSAEDEEPDMGSHFEFEDLEHLMSEIGGMRDSLRLMPEFQRREMLQSLL